MGGLRWLRPHVQVTSPAAELLALAVVGRMVGQRMRWRITAGVDLTCMGLGLKRVVADLRDAGLTCTAARQVGRLLTLRIMVERRGGDRSRLRLDPGDVDLKRTPARRVEHLRTLRIALRPAVRLDILKIAVVPVVHLTRL
jgi:hypothetical protein